MASVQQDDLVGRTVDARYRVLAHIADGGMGSVYAALDTRLDRQVALKVMRPELARDPDFVTRFRREARSAASLTHPGVVGVFDQGEDDGLLFLAMEFVDGQTLRDLLADKGALTPREAFAVTEGVLDALRAASRKGIVHRDIKPENVLISNDDQVKVADFGLARAMGTSTSTGRAGPLLGTVAYLAPEQVEHGRADHRSDLYGVGLLLHEMLTGRPAVEGESPIHIAWQHVNGALAAPSAQVADLPETVDELVATATRTNPDDRFQDADAFLAALRATRMGLPDEILDRRPEIGAGGAAIRATGETPRHDTSRLDRATRTLPTLGSSTGASVDGGPAPAGPSPVGASATREHGRRGGRGLLLTVLLALLLLAGGGAAYWWFGPPGDRTVPRVVGLDRVVAESSLHENDLQPMTEEEFSETVPRDQVIRSSVEEGTVVRRGSQVSLVVSRGPERYEVPDVAGRTVAEATSLLAERKFVVSDAPRRAYHEEIPEGRLVATAPEVGTSAAPGTQVTLILSRGREPVSVDGVVGTPSGEAQRRLEEAGLTVVVAEDQKFSTDVPKGSVLSIDPAEGPLYRGDTVTLTVSRGPEMVAVPDVRGMPAKEAERALEQAGFTVRVNRIAGGIFGTAHSTEPTGGSAPKGSTIVLNVV